MKKLLRLVQIVVLVELIGGGTVCGWRMTRPPVPSVDLGALDTMTADEVRTLQEKARFETAENWLNLAKAYTVFGYFPQAELCCRLADKLKPNLVDVHFWWGIAEDRLGRPLKAIDHFTLVAEKADKPMARVVWYCIGRNWLRREDGQAAEAAFRQAGGLLHARYALSRLLLQTNRPEEAATILGGLIKENPQMHRFHQLRARAARQQNDSTISSEQRDWFDRASNDFGADTIADFLTEEANKYGLRKKVAAAKLLLRSKRPAEAEAQFREILAIEWNPEAADGLITFALKRNDTHQALQLVDELIKRDGINAKSLIDRGTALFMQGDETAAIESWHRATRISHSAGAHLRLAEIYARKRDSQKSQQHQALAHQARGIVAFRQNKLKPAAESLEKAVQLDANLEYAWLFLAECRRFLEQHKPAESAYKRCLEINPYNGRALTGLKRLKPTKTTPP